LRRIIDFVQRFANDPPPESDVVAGPGFRTPPAPASLPDRVPVLFRGGTEVNLDLTRVAGRLSFGILHSLRQFDRLAHVETDDDGVVTRTLIPIVTRVRDVRPIGNGTFHVRLERSNCRHVARASTADERERIRTLINAAGSGELVAVTSDPEEHVILHVERSRARRPTEPRVRGFSAKESIERASTVSEEEVRELFASIASHICRLPLPPHPDLQSGIPYQYPDDACWAVAHKVFELIEAEGVRAGKIWLFDGEPDRHGLRITTRNRSRCFQMWDWHVAACVKAAKPGTPRILVLDPVAFLADGPLDRHTWARKLGKRKHGQFDFTAGEVYSQAIPQDPHYIPVEPGETEGDLILNLWKLAERSGGNESPPPYAQCSRA
jgi:hypothetical protein